MSGIRGALCFLSACTREEADGIMFSFSINRSSNESSEIWQKLASGELVKRSHDSNVRQCVTQDPIVP